MLKTANVRDALKNGLTALAMYESVCLCKNLHRLDDGLMKAACSIVGPHPTMSGILVRGDDC